MEKTVGEVISARLRDMEKTQGWLAEAVGVSDYAVSKWISTGKISRKNAIITAEKLQISVDELLSANKAGSTKTTATASALTLTYVDPQEMQLLTWYREANDIGKEIIKASCEHAPKKKLVSGPASIGEL